MDQSEVAMDEIVHAARRDPQDGVPGEQSRELARLSCETRLAADAGGAKWLTRRLSVPEEKMCAWVSHARLHGVDVLCCLVKIASSAPTAKLRRSMTSAFPARLSPDAEITLKAACRLIQDDKEVRPEMKTKRRCAAPSNVVAHRCAANPAENVCWMASQNR